LVRAAEYTTFLAGGGTNFEEGGEENAADGRSLDVAGRGRIDIMLWGRLFPEYKVRVMRTLPSRMPLGRKFMLRHNMELDLGRDLESLEMKTKRGRARFNGSIWYGQREVSTKGSISEVQESIEAVGEEDIRDAIEAIDYAEFGNAEGQKALQEVLLERRDVFRSTTSIMRGPDFSIKLQDGADIPRLNRVAFRKSPLEKKVEEIEMKKLLELGIMEPSVSPVARQMSWFRKRRCRTGNLEVYG
jgi:hypothetical protein